MVDVHSVVTENIDVWTGAIKKRNATGRGSKKKLELTGILKLRELILELAMTGSLVPQNPKDEPASTLLEKISIEKEQLLAEKVIRKPKLLPQIDECEKTFNTPNGWGWARLGTICKKVTDGSHNPPRNAGEGYPMLSSQNVNYGVIDFSSPSRFVTEENFQKENMRTLIKPQDVLLNIVASIGRSAVVPDNAPKFVLQRSVAVLDSMLDSQFLAKQLVAPCCLSYYDKHAKGTAQKGIYLGKLSLMVLAVPPLAEQHRIVAKVDELMALCDQLEQQTEDSITAHKSLVETLLGALTNSANAKEFNESWKRIAQHFDILFTTDDSIEQLKQTILQLAVMGKLVPQDPNDEPASVLLEKIAKEKERLVAEKKIKKQKALPDVDKNNLPFKLPKGWDCVNFSDLAIRMGSGSTPRGGKSAYEEQGIPFLRSQNVRNEGVDLRDVAFINDATHQKMSNTTVYPNDLLLNITGGSLGRSTIYPSNIGEANVSQHVSIIRLYEMVDVKFIHLCVLSPYIQSLIWGRQVGMAREGLSKKVLELFEFPVPPLKEQERIVKKVGELMSLCDQLKKQLSDAQTTQLHLADAIVEQAVG